MKFIQSGLLTLLVSLFILSGCNNPTGIGLDLDPNSVLNSKVDSVSIINAKLIHQKDRFVTNFNSQAVLSYFKDPIFGTTTASIAVGLNLPSAGFRFGINPILDSAVLVLPFADFYGDSLNTSYQVEVHQLDEVLYNESSTPYYSDKIWKKKAPIIGTKTFKPNRDSIILQDIVVGKRDTVKKVSGQLRIRLDPSFINTILTSDSLNRVSNLAFNNFIKGLYVSLNKSNTTNNGGMFTFSTANANCRLDLFYKKTSSTSTIDTVTTSLSFNGEAGIIANELSWDFTGTPVQTELQSSAPISDKLYFKGLNGTSAKLDIPAATLTRLKGLGKNVTINRAELILSVENGTQTPYAPLPRLRIFRWDIAQRPQFLPDESQNALSIGVGFIGGFYNSANKRYVFNVTRYIQDLMNNRTKDYGTFITTSDFSNASSLLSNLRRSVVGGSNPNYKIKLKVYYTDQK